MATEILTGIHASTKMVSGITSYRVLYADTDAMGILHHSKYVVIYEYARWEVFRQLGLTYKSIEEEGIMMPVISVNIDYLKPVYYDELVTIEVDFRVIRNTKIEFHYKMVNQKGVCVNVAKMELAFMNSGNRKPIRIPGFINSFVSYCNSSV